MQTGVDLGDVAFGGLINEDVLQQIFDISRIPLPLTDRIGTDSHGNAFCEWTTDELSPVDVNNAVEDGQTTNTLDNTKEGARKGNHSQISVKVVEVSTRGRDSDTIGFQDALNYQVMQRNREIRRDVEGIMLTNQGSVKAASGVAGKAAGLGAWIINGVDNASTPGGWQSGTGLVTGRTPSGDASDVPMTETMVRAASRSVYDKGGEATIFMSTPSLCEEFSAYLFTSSARVAALQSDVNQQRSAVTATGAVNVFVSDWSTLEIVGNRLQQVADPGTGTTEVNAYVLDPSMIRLSYLTGYRVEPLAKTGLSDQRQMIVDWSLKVLNEDAQAIIAGIDQTAPVTT